MGSSEELPNTVARVVWIGSRLGGCDGWVVVVVLVVLVAVGWSCSSSLRSAAGCHSCDDHRPLLRCELKAAKTCLTAGAGSLALGALANQTASALTPPPCVLSLGLACRFPSKVVASPGICGRWMANPGLTYQNMPGSPGLGVDLWSTCSKALDLEIGG